MTRKPAFACIAFLFSTTAGAQTPLSPQDMFVDRLFAQSGFTPLITTRDAPVDVMRVLVQDPYRGLPIPGISIERYREGRTIMMLHYRGWNDGPIVLDEATWHRLVEANNADRSREAAIESERRGAIARALAEQPAEVVNANGVMPPPPPPPPPVCHAWSARIQTSDGARRSWSECGGEAPPALMTAVLATALATRPQCHADSAGPLWQFNRCFGIAPEFDDVSVSAELQRYRDGLVTDGWDLEKDLIRQVLFDSNVTIGSPTWLQARDRITGLRAALARREAELHRISVTLRERNGLSDADRWRLERALDMLRQQMGFSQRHLEGLILILSGMQ